MPATVRKLDFTDVKDQGQFNRRRKPSGEYRAKITSVDDHEANSGKDNFLFTVQVDGDRRASYPIYCGIETKALWKLRNLFIATGLRPPAGKAKIDPNKLLNRVLGVLLEDDEYEGRMNSVIADFFPIGEDNDFLNDGEASTKKKKSRVVEDDDDEDDEPAPAKKSKKVVEDDDDDEEEDDEEEEPPPAKKKKKAKKVVEEDDDDEEDDEPPVKKAKKKRRVADDDELDTDEL